MYKEKMKGSVKGDYSMRNFEQSEFYCVKCGKRGLPCFRNKGQKREKGHLKKLYCVNCNDTINHIEIKPDGRYSFEDFKLEYEYGNFNENQERIYTLNQLKEMIENGKLEKQKTLGDMRDSGFGKINLDTES